MKLHANARTCPKSRRLIGQGIEEEGWSLAAAAEAAGVSERTAAKWLARWRAEGEAGLADRSSAREARPTRLPAERVKAIEALRRLRMTAAEIAECLSMALSTVSRWLQRIGLGKRSRLEPPEPPNRYERKRPGELIHVDVKKLGRIQRRAATGSRATRAVRSRDGPKRLRAARLGVRPRLRRRRHPPRLRRGARRREGRDGRRLSAAGGRLVQIDGDHGRAGDERQRRLLSLDACTPTPAASSGSGTCSPALPAPHQRQGRALHPDPAQPLGLRSHLRHLGRAHRGAARLAHLLQLHPTTWLPRPQAARSSARRAGTTS